MSAGLVDLFGSKLLSGVDEVNTSDALAGRQAVAIYFSAHWCPPCRGFTPKLAEWYSAGLKDKLEIVFVSSDKDESAFKDYFSAMPWKALPYRDRELKDKLSKKFKVQGIPTVVIVDGDGKVISFDGRSMISEDPTGENFTVKAPTFADASDDLPRLVVLLSGGGTSLQNILDKIDAGTLRARVALVVSSKDGVKGLQRAEAKNVPTKVVASANYRKDKKTDWTSFSKEINSVVLAAKPDLVVLAGFMCFYEVPPELENKVINIHPALLPAFGGQGMYGEHVHKAVVKRGARIHGCTVHFVTNDYDAGPIILQRSCAIDPARESADDVQKKVFQEECLAMPEAIRLCIDGRLTVKDGIVHVAEAPVGSRTSVDVAATAKNVFAVLGVIAVVRLARSLMR